MTYLWLSGVFFQALNTQKIVFSRILPIPFPLDAFGISVVRSPTQISGYSYSLPHFFLAYPLKKTWRQPCTTKLWKWI